MKLATKLIFLLLTVFTIISAWADRPVKITVDWEDTSYENKVEVYDQANNLILTICNSNIPDPDNPVNQCYTASGTEDVFTAVYDLGCIQSGNYYVRLFSIDNNSWSSSSYILVNVDGTDVIVDDGTNASDTGFDINFSVANGGSSCSPANVDDTDGDGVIDRVDLDDDNDGIPDADEGLGINTFDCTIPALNFTGNNNTPETGIAGTVGAIYRFENAIFGEPYDVLVEITEIRNTILLNIDDDTVDTENYLQTRLEFSGDETPADCAGCDYPGITFQFTIVDTGTSTPAAALFRIGGTTWDMDGSTSQKESTRYYNPSAYGTDNPTTLTISDINGDNSVIEMAAGGILEGPGFSTLPQLRSYFQFLSNTFTLRMQNIRTFTSANQREYGMSFTQCDVLDFASASIVIVNGQNDDGDAYDNHVDLDADNDGIPDNVEAQTTTGYIAPSGNIDPLSGEDVNYLSGFEYVDTDGDRVYDFLDTDSDGDGKPDITENGMADSIAGEDQDQDGLDTIFETNGNETGANPVFDVNEDIEDPTDLSILPDTDGDLALGGDLDYRDGLDVYVPSASVDFDGVDDFIEADKFLDGLTAATIMAWVKPSADNVTQVIVAGQENFYIYLNGLTPGVQVVSNTDDYVSRNAVFSDVLVADQWAHLTAVYNAADSSIKIYINGEESIDSLFIPTISGTALSSTIGDAAAKFAIGKNGAEFGTQFYKGNIDEVRVFDMALTDEQIQRLVYQEIEQNGADVEGKIIPGSVSATIPWTNLQAYWPMTNILTSKTVDASSYSRNADLRNILTVQEQNAPMPYETQADGPWTTEGTWLHGDVWDIEDIPNNKDWSIVSINDNVTTSASHAQLGMFIDTDKTLSVTGSNAVTNSLYLELNGTLDLADDSQLIQTENSNLVTSATGRVLRRQEGNANAYWYNYWSSPVGAVGATSLTNNNGPGNNTNNSTFNIGMLEDGIGAAMEFTSAFNEVGKISNRWLYSFQNGQTYYGWIALSPASAILPGVGYTQKGTGNAGTEQQYTFNGKPNNGTILVSADDVEGDSGNESEQDVTLTTTMVGNPYPSALDADEFIRDNTDFANGGANPIIGGTILLWEQWAGNSHNLADYQGGYGYINLTETARAYQHPDIPIAGQTQTQGIKTPTKFISVGQGFFVEVVNDGNIEFNNSQRVFKEETLGESVFFRSTPEAAVATTQRNADATDTAMQIIKLEFGVSNGATRRFVLGFSDDTTDGFDYGYDGGLITTSPGEDMTSLLGDQQFVIQAMSPITEDKVIDLKLHTSGTYTYSLDIVDIKNIDTNQAIYLRDHQEDVYWDLRDGAYSFTATGGSDSDRFDIVFKNDQTLSNDDVLLEGTVIFANSKEHKLYVKGLTETTKVLTLTNMLGQRVKVFQSPETNTLENGLHIGELSSGVYLVNLITETNSKLNKKIILE